MKNWDLLKDDKFNEPLINIGNSLDNISKVLNLKTNNNNEVKYPNIINRSGRPDDTLKDNDLASSQWFSQNWMFGKDKPTKKLADYRDENQRLNSVEFHND